MSTNAFQIVDQNTKEILATLPLTIPIGLTVEGFEAAGYVVTWKWAETPTDDCLYRGQAYFAQDGAYGEATDILICDTTQWVGDDWDEVIEAADMHRLEAAQEIHNRYLTLVQNYVTINTSDNSVTLTKGN